MEIVRLKLLYMQISNVLGEVANVNIFVWKIHALVFAPKKKGDNVGRIEISQACFFTRLLFSIVHIRSCSTVAPMTAVICSIHDKVTLEEIVNYQL